MPRRNQLVGQLVERAGDGELVLSAWRNGLEDSVNRATHVRCVLREIHSKRSVGQTNSTYALHLQQVRRQLALGFLQIYDISSHADPILPQKPSGEKALP